MFASGRRDVLTGNGPRPLKSQTASNLMGRVSPVGIPFCSNQKKVLSFYSTKLALTPNSGGGWFAPVPTTEKHGVRPPGCTTKSSVRLKTNQSSWEGQKSGPSWQIHFERSLDNGKTWQFVSVPQASESPAAIQPSILMHPEGRLQALGRTKASRIFSTTSNDNGLTWTPLSLLDLPNPNSGTDAVTLKDGRHVLIYNHAPKGRSPLNVAISKDGREWEAALVLEDKPGEYSYPAVIQTRDGLLHFTYTWKRVLAKHVVVDPSMLTLTPIVHGEWPVGR